MKKIVLLTCISIVIILIAIIIYFVLPWWAIYTELQSSPNIIEPKVRNAQFSFKIEYEVNGERYTLEDTLECEYVLSINEGTGKSYQLKQQWKNDKNKYYVHTLYEVNDETIIQYVSPGAEYFMGETDEILDLSYPPINIVNKCTWKREKLDSNSLLTRYGFKVLSYQCDQPIKTEEKTGERAIH